MNQGRTGFTEIEHLKQLKVISFRIDLQEVKRIHLMFFQQTSRGHCVDYLFFQSGIPPENVALQWLSVELSVRFTEYAILACLTTV